MVYNDSIFEWKVKATTDHDFYNYRMDGRPSNHNTISSDFNHNVTNSSSSFAKKGDFYLDCSAGAFRDFNVAAHLLKYSPKTKIIMIVRDPWQVNFNNYIN